MQLEEVDGLISRRRRFSEQPFGETAIRLMAETGVTFRGLAAKTGLSAGYLNHIMHGNRPVPSNEILARLARALGVEPEHFLEYRVRVITERLERMPDLVDRLYKRLGYQLTDGAERIDGGAAHPHLEVEVRPCRTPCRAHCAEPGAECDAVEQADVDPLEMRVERPDAAAVRDDDRVAEAAQRPRPNRTAGAWPSQACRRRPRSRGRHGPIRSSARTHRRTHCQPAG